jgi:Pentapeptide repeats (9 copies)
MLTPSRAIAAAVRGSHIVGSLQRGAPVTLQKATIFGRVDLRPLGTIQPRFMCIRCRFLGSVVATGVTLGGIDLIDSSFEGRVTFANATFLGDALFDGSRFSTGPSFDGATFHGVTSFSRAVFEQGGGFVRSRFDQRADFSASEIRGSFSLADAKLGTDGGTFFEAVLSTGSFGLVALDLSRLTSGGDLDFSAASIEDFVVLDDAVIDGVLSFQDARFLGLSRLSVHGERVHELSLAVDDVQRAPSVEQRRLLSLIEAGAKARDDAATANDAEYELRVLKAKSYDRPLRMVDAVFYRGAAGYLIRPLRPLAVLLGLAALGVALRRRRQRTHPHSIRMVSGASVTIIRGSHTPVRGPRRRRTEPLTDFLGEVWDRLATIIPRRADPTLSAGRNLLERLEVLTLRLLFVCFLVALARTNPSLRDMVRALG